MATIVKRGDSYKITVSCGYDDKGKQIRRHTTWTPDANMTKRQVDRELQRQVILFEDDCAGVGISGTIKFKPLAEEWLLHVERNNILRPKTLYEVKKLSNRIYEAIGHLRADRITPLQIQKFIDNLAENGMNKKTNGGLSSKTQEHYLTFISNVFNYAVKFRMLKENPCAVVSVKKHIKLERESYTLEEAQLFIEKIQTEPFNKQAYFLIALLGGLRAGELRGLMWDDIDFDNETISIHRTASYIPKQGIIIGDTKTEKSHRTLKMPEIIFTSLRALKKEQTEHRLKIGSQWYNNNLVFATWNGKVISGTTPTRWLQSFCKNNNFRYITAHGLRHTNATLLIYSGTDIKTVSSALGHSQASTTLNIYSHALASAQARASDALANALLQKEDASAKKA